MIDWDRIENFIGFGRRNASVVFLGMEEGLRRDADLLADLQARSAFEPCIDLSEAQRRLGGAGSYFGRTPITQNTWRPMCHVMLRRSGILHPTLDQRLRYQADRLGRTDGDTLLTELLPYPHSDSGQWLYSQFGRYQNRVAYASDLIPRRQAFLRQIFREHSRELIVAYGKANWPHYKEIFAEATWHVEGSFEFGNWRDGRVVLTHGLSSKEFNTYEQLDRFAAIALDGSRAVARQHVAATATAMSGSSSSENAGHTARPKLHSRESLGKLAREYRTAKGLTLKEVSDKAKAFAGQGNPTGVSDLERSKGWVHPKFAEGVFRAVGMPDAQRLGALYRELKEHDPRS